MGGVNAVTAKSKMASKIIPKNLLSMGSVPSELSSHYFAMRRAAQSQS
jgi:hypothetical protein